MTPQIITLTGDNAGQELQIMNYSDEKLDIQQVKSISEGFGDSTRTIGFEFKMELHCVSFIGINLFNVASACIESETSIMLFCSLSSVNLPMTIATAIAKLIHSLEKIQNNPDIFKQIRDDLQSAVDEAIYQSEEEEDDDDEGDDDDKVENESMQKNKSGHSMTVGPLPDHFDVDDLEREISGRKRHKPK